MADLPPAEVRTGAWLYVQEQGDGVVSFVGSSRVSPGQSHPLRFGSGRTHQFILGELAVRPRLLVATDALCGTGLAGLAVSDHDVARMLAKGEVLVHLDHLLS